MGGNRSKLGLVGRRQAGHNNSRDISTPLAALTQRRLPGQDIITRCQGSPRTQVMALVKNVVSHC